MNKNMMLDAALKYANEGLSVFPVAPRGKEPITQHGYKDASQDPEQIKKWWTDNPTANIGCPTGLNDLLVVDIDNHDDGSGEPVDGSDSLREFERNHGELPETANSITGGGGYHYLFRTNRKVKSRIGVLPGIDIKADGGYIILPPSIHPNGDPYIWENTIDEIGITEANDLVYELATMGKSKKNKKYRMPNEIIEGGRHDSFFKVACSMRATGLSQDGIEAALLKENERRCSPPLPEKDIATLAKDVTNRYLPGSSNATEKSDIDFRVVPSGKKDADGIAIMKIEQSIDNMVLAFEEDPDLRGKLRYDITASEPKYLGQPPWRKAGDTFGQWVDADDSNARALLYRKYGLRGASLYEDAFNIIMLRHQFNPVVDFLEGLEEWDGEDHISRLLPDYLGAEDSSYTREVQKLDLLQRISRAYNPGCAADHAMVLVGPQGCGKTTYGKRLSIAPEWYGKLSTIEGKDAVENLRGKILVELDELLALKKAKEVEAVKSFITTTVDTFREPYGRRSVDHPRFCTFIGTTNDTSFLTDRTGNRRFLPVQCAVNPPTKDLWSADAKDDFLKAYAQALHIFKETDCKPELVLPKDIREEATRVQGHYLEEDPRVGLIQKYLDQSCFEKACIIELWQKALDMPGQPKRSDSNQLHAIMRNDIDGWVEAGVQRFTEYGRQRAYKRIEGRVLDGFTEDDGGIPF